MSRGVGCIGIFFAILGFAIIAITTLAGPALGMTEWFAEGSVETGWGYVAIGVFLFGMEAIDMAYRKWKKKRH